MNALAAERDRVVADFRSFASALEAGDPDWLAPVREAAIDRFAKLGFPTARREDWKYTDATPIARAVSREPAAAVAAVDAEILAGLGIAAAEHALVFVNGRFAPELSSRGALPEGAVVDGLANVLRDRPELVEPLLNRPSAVGERCFVELNAAFQRDGAFVSLPPGAVLTEPIQLFFLATGDAGKSAHHPHNLIAVGEAAEAVVVERYIGVGDAEYLTNAVTDLSLGAGARLDRVALECESARAIHVGTLTARLARDAHFRSHVVSLSAGLARNEIHAVLDAAGAECVLNGLFVADGRRQVDNQTTIDHAKPNGTSRELYKGVLGGRSKGVFNGKVIVRPDAQKTNAQQSNPNLLLSDGAEIDTRPNLEIHADDVKCSHGSTIGRLDDDALFFLRARGIGEARARQMLCRAFASEVIDAIPGATLREEIGRSVAAKLGDAGVEAA